MGGKRRKTAAERFDVAEANGLTTLDQSEIDGNQVFRALEPCTENRYKAIMDFWDEFERRNPGASPHNLKAAKFFAECIGQCRNVSQPSLLAEWYHFLGAWRRRPGATRILKSVTESVTEFIKTTLTEKLGLSTETRPRHFMTVPHFIVLEKQMWIKDWHLYQHSGTIVDDHAAYLLSIFTSGRVGEYLESNARRGSGRGLKYGTIHFVVFKNEAEEAEIAICVQRDAKGFTHKPHQRPLHGLYEDMQPLFVNPVLPFLANALANDVFKDYHTYNEIEAIPPPADGSLHHLQIKKEMLEVPFFRQKSWRGSSGNIVSACPVTSRLVALGHRAGYPENIHFHDFRREALVKADASGYSEAERMKFAGHTDRAIFGKYMAPVSEVDGQSLFAKRKRRTVHLEALRGMSLHHHPQLLQSLPAKVQDDMERRPDIVALDKKIEALGEKLKGLSTGHEAEQDRARREELYWQKRQLASAELNKWREIQPNKITTSTADEPSPVAALPSFFNRIRRLDPPRDRLARSLFLNVPLRSAQGREALDDMIALYKGAPPVAYRPSVRPEEGHCPVSMCAKEMDSFEIRWRWEHVYRCCQASLRRQHGFAELCFQCDEWVTSEAGWHDHCQGHLDDLWSLPVQFNLLYFRHTVADPGRCPFCMFNPKLPPPQRMRQILKATEWKDHLHGHFRELEREEQRALALLERKPVSCPDERCTILLDSVRELQFHCQDAHCIPRIKDDAVKRRRVGSL